MIQQDRDAWRVQFGVISEALGEDHAVARIAARAAAGDDGAAREYWPVARALNDRDSGLLDVAMSMCALDPQGTAARFGVEKIRRVDRGPIDRCGRLPDWNDRLTAFLKANWRRPLKYGAFDCVLFGCAADEAMTGKHRAPYLIGDYSTEKGAAKAMRRHFKATSVSGVADAVFGRSIPIEQAQHGDVVEAVLEESMATAEGPAIGVCWRPLHAVFVGRAGLQFMPIEWCRRAFPMGVKP